MSHPLPTGWTKEDDESRQRTYLVAPDTETHCGGAVTVYWLSRKYALGYDCQPDRNIPDFTGRAWRDRLVAAAAQHLEQHLLPRRRRPASQS